MIALILNIVLSVGFFHTIRAAQVQKRNMMVVGAVNYLLASSLCFGISLAEGNASLSGSTLFWGTVQGVAFVWAYYLICASMAVSGMAIAVALLRVSVVIPVLASIFCWGEVPGLYQVLGIFACILSLPLIGTRPRNMADGRPVSWREVRVIGLLFVGAGIAGVASKAFVESGVPDARTTYMGVLFGVAAIGALLSFASPVWRRDLSGVRNGLQLGVVNVAAILSQLVALGQVSGVVAFPVLAAGGLVLNTLFAAAVWRERFARKTLIGMAVAAVGLAMVNLK